MSDPASDGSDVEEEPTDDVFGQTEKDLVCSAGLVDEEREAENRAAQEGLREEDEDGEQHDTGGTGDGGGPAGTSSLRVPRLWVVVLLVSACVCALTFKCMLFFSVDRVRQVLQHGQLGVRRGGCRHGRLNAPSG